MLGTDGMFRTFPEGRVGFAQFVCLVYGFSAHSWQNMCRYVYGLFDEEGRGQLTMTAVRATVGALHGNSVPWAAAKALASMDMDRGARQTVSLHEFCRNVREFPALMSPAFDVQMKVRRAFLRLLPRASPKVPVRAPFWEKEGEVPFDVILKLVNDVSVDAPTPRWGRRLARRLSSKLKGAIIGGAGKAAAAAALRSKRLAKLRADAAAVAVQRDRELARSHRKRGKRLATASAKIKPDTDQPRLPCKQQVLAPLELQPLLQKQPFPSFLLNTLPPLAAQRHKPLGEAARDWDEAQVLKRNAQKQAEERLHCALHKLEMEQGAAAHLQAQKEKAAAEQAAVELEKERAVAEKGRVQEQEQGAGQQLLRRMRAAREAREQKELKAGKKVLRRAKAMRARKDAEREEGVALANAREKRAGDKVLGLVKGIRKRKGALQQEALDHTRVLREERVALARRERSRKRSLVRSQIGGAWGSLEVGKEMAKAQGMGAAPTANAALGGPVEGSERAQKQHTAGSAAKAAAPLAFAKAAAPQQNELLWHGAFVSKQRERDMLAEAAGDHHGKTGASATVLAAGAGADGGAAGAGRGAGTAAGPLATAISSPSATAAGRWISKGGNTPQ
jgi:hypothetical protein